jgi:HlyD family secretion protein
MFLLPFVAAMLAYACGGGSSADGLTLESSVVTRGDLESSVEATGTIEPIKVVEVKSQASGEILEMRVDLGDQVEKGALLLRIDPRDVQNELEQALADLNQAEAQVQVATSRLDRARALRDSGVVTQSDLESAILEHANARSSYQRAESRLELARDRREDATINAPISGTVIEKVVEEGQVITSTNSVTGGTTLLRMADLSEVQVRTLVDESDVGQIQAGQPASITVEAYPDRTFEGAVLKIEPQATVQQNVTMFAVLTRIPNPARLLRPGMNADVVIVLGREENVLKLPNAGVKMPEEARQLVNALQMDPSLLDQAAPSLANRGTDGDSVQRAQAGEPGASNSQGEGKLPSPDELRSMSQEERRALFQSLSPSLRQQLMERFRGSSAAGPRAGRSGPRKAFVFEYDAQGKLTLKPILVGMSSWEETAIVAGLSEGDTVVEVPLALVQQSEMLERFRRRSGVPGMNGG